MYILELLCKARVQFGIYIFLAVFSACPYILKADVYVEAPWVEFPLTLVNQTNGFFNAANHNYRVKVKEKSRLVEINGTTLWFHNGNDTHDEKLRFHPDDIQYILNPVLEPPPIAAAKKQLIVLDPGHGGDDTGALSVSKIAEKTVNLAIAKRLKLKLEKWGHEVIMTRDSDEQSLSLDERPGIAENESANLFISLHANKAGNEISRGIETFCLSLPGQRSTNDPKSQNPDQKNWPGNKFNLENSWLAYTVHHSLVRHSSFGDRGIKRARFRVLKLAPCPAILIECGFLSSKEDEQFFLKDSYLDYIAQRIANGVQAYFKGLK